MKRLVPSMLATALVGCGAGTKTVTVTTPATTTAQSTTAATGTTPAVQTTASTETATVDAKRTVPILHVPTFKSPSGNIGCIIVSGIARCDIKHRSWSPPPTPKSCPPVVNYGQGLLVTGSGPGRLVCAGDTALDPTARTLPYGTDTHVARFHCTSRTTGITCTKTDTNHGFFISFASYRTF